MTVAAKSAGSVTYRHPKTEEKEQEVASRPPVSKTAREILSEIQDEQKGATALFELVVEKVGRIKIPKRDINLEFLELQWQHFVRHF